jgi:hypothetical protein
VSDVCPGLKFELGRRGMRRRAAPDNENDQRRRDFARRRCQYNNEGPGVQSGKTGMDG